MLKLSFILFPSSATTAPHFEQAQFLSFPFAVLILAHAGIPHGIFAHLRNERFKTVDVVGPVCESSDFLARQRHLPEFVAGDLMAIGSAGAYASSMGSTYNMRPLSPEVLVSGTASKIIRRRQSYKEMTDLYWNDTLPSS